MAKKKTNDQELIDIAGQEGALTEEQIKIALDFTRKTLKEKFDKWLTVYDEAATDEDIQVAKDDFDKYAADYQTSKMAFLISEDHAADYATLLRDWNKNYNHWKNGEWKGVVMFDKIVNEMIEKYNADPAMPFEIGYDMLMWLYNAMCQPEGMGFESAMAMANFENFDRETCERRDNGNYVTYSHILEVLKNHIVRLSAVQKMLNLRKERIQLATAGIKIDWKISEIEEFVQLSDAWVSQNLPDDDKQLQKMAQ